MDTYEQFEYIDNSRQNHRGRSRDVRYSVFRIPGKARSIERH